MKTFISALLVTVFVMVALAQDIPQDIAKKDLPASATCFICNEGEEKVAGGVMYKNKAYYFCNATEIKNFKKDPESYVPPVLPRPAPTIDLADTAGKMWNVEAMKGKLVLIDFWASWCQPCIAMMPAIDKLHAKYKDRGFEVLSISIDEKKPDFEKFLKKHTFPNPVLLDTTKTWNRWGVTAIPATFLVKDGQIVAQWRGKQTELTFSETIEKHL